MSVDKRSVHTDALETLGTIIDDKQARDAIHLAVEPVIAGERLRAGEHIYLKDGKAYLDYNSGRAVGIVDPFLEETVAEGERFWLVVFPRKITSLRHVWTHPDFDDLTHDLRPYPEDGGLKEPVRSFSNYTVDMEGVDPDRLETFLAKERQNKDRNTPAWLWLRNFADGIGVDVDELLERAESYQEYGDYWSEGGRFEGEYIPNEFWEHYTEVTGKPASDRYSFFSCSC